MPKKITVFTRPTCAPCRALKNYLQRKGIVYSEVNVDETPEAQASLISMSGRSMVPMTVIVKQDDSQEVISGLNLAQINSAISA